MVFFNLLKKLTVDRFKKATVPEEEAPYLLRTAKKMTHAILALQGKPVGEVMIPRARIVALEERTGLCEMIRKIRETGYSRYPIYRDHLDNPLGMIHIRDIFSLFDKSTDPADLIEREKQKKSDTPLGGIVREVLYVPSSMVILELFLRMQTARTHMALVVDEYGGTDGLVTFEDLVEEIVGDIHDEHDMEEVIHIAKLGTDLYEVDARISLDELEKRLHFSLSEESIEDVETLGGLVFSVAGRIPQRGEVIKTTGGLALEISDCDIRKIYKVRIRKEKHPALNASDA